MNKVKMSKEIKVLFLECLQNGEINEVQAEVLNEFLVKNDLAKQWVVNFISSDNKKRSLL